MIGQNRFFGYAGFLMLAFLISCSSVFAASEKSILLVTENLSQKLRGDLSNSSVTVKLNKVEERRISGSETELKGDATAILADADNRLPVEFEVRVNSDSGTVTDVKYNFVEDAANYALTSSEEVLMKELMTKIRQDYKTENIVIAIDGIENVAGAGSEQKFLGVGEVRIGDLVWNRIKFDVSLDAQTQKASKIVYKVEK